MGTTAEELRLEIEAKRDELGDDLAALGHHVAPAQVAQRAGQATAARIRDGVRTVQDALRGDAAPTTRAGRDQVAGGGPPANPGLADNPAAVAAISALVGLLVGAFLSRRRARRRARRGA